MQYRLFLQRTGTWCLHLPKGFKISIRRSVTCTTVSSWIQIPFGRRAAWTTQLQCKPCGSLFSPFLHRRVGDIAPRQRSVAHHTCTGISLVALALLSCIMCHSSLVRRSTQNGLSSRSTSGSRVRCRSFHVIANLAVFFFSMMTCLIASSPRYLARLCPQGHETLV